jgi:hypothetical protein
MDWANPTAELSQSAAALNTEATPTILTSNTDQTWDFADFVLNPTETAEFRIFGFNASTADGFFTVDNVTLNGVRTVAPEPGSLLLAGFVAMLGAGGWQVRRRRLRLLSEQETPAG